MAGAVKPRFVPPPFQDAAEQGRLILRDGSTATIRLAQPQDAEALRVFFDGLSPESRRRRFFSVAPPVPELITSLADSSDPRSALTLLVIRTAEGGPRIVATGSYFAKDERTAEVAFAVDESFHGKGLGTLLLERLAVLAVRNGFTRFWAITHADNRAMRDVFRESGFAVAEELRGSEIEVDLSVVPNEAAVARLETRDRIATAASLRPFFRPRSVAVVGASRDPASIGYRILEALVGSRFQGPVYPVNPKAMVVSCIRAYPSVRDLPEPVDLAVVAVPRDAVLGVVDECAARGVRALVVITAGFAEVNAEGRELQKRLVEKVRGYGMRLIGPNCLGLLNTDPAVRLNASFSPLFPPPGRVAMSSQSGALGLAVLAAARRMGLGLSTFVSVGNKADVSGNDLLQYWEDDPGTDVILLYLESFGNPRRFARIAQRVSRRKPVVAIKSGRTQAGGRAAGSHTAALAAKEVAVDALFRLTGVIRADTLEEMFDLAAALGSQPLPHGRRVGIVTNAGGPAILCADACEAAGLVLPEFSAQTQARLRSVLPAAASVANPVDMIASAGPGHYAPVVETVLCAEEVDALIVIYIPVGLCQTDALVAAIRSGVEKARASAAGKPVLACLMTESGEWSHFDGGEQLPTYAFPEAAARVLGKMAGYADWRSRPEGMIPDYEDLDLPTARAVCQRALAERGNGWLSAEESRAVLEAVKLPVPPGGVARSADEAVALAERVGFPAAVKLASRQLVHKTEVGGVCLNLANADAVRQAFTAIRDRVAQTHQPDAMDGVVVQPMIPRGVEVMIGVTQDPLFGPLIAFGLGGVYVEILADVCFRVTPLTDRDAAEMVQSIRGHRLLAGYRGQPPADVDAIQDVLLRISRLVEEISEISEIDLNPVFALPPGQGCWIADMRIEVRAPS
ncbi:MAG TPA: GNAT family N-acetyltransferase [Gemmataceae bacterium]|jgi:acetyl coenzyme A synthetase (ADP forming)-like protein|nr:GNAT family N-acetyltransferase [Gemmataceae bacterium]